VINQVDRAVVLAAGLGTRLKWLTAGQPKAMMDVAGEPSIVHVIRRLAGQGISDIAINVHHHAEKLVDYLGDGSKFGARLYYSYEEKLLDSGGGVRKAMDLLPESGLIAVHNADVLADIDIQQLAAVAVSEGGSLAMVNNPPHHPLGDFGLNDGLIVNDKHPSYTYSGVSVWDGKVFRVFESGEMFSLTLPMRLVMDQLKLTGALHHGEWFDIGRPRDLMQARLVAKRR